MMTETQQYDQADIYFAKALEKDPKNATFYVHRGLLQLQLNGNINKAVEYIQKAIEVDKKCELAYESLGSIEVQRYASFNYVQKFVIEFKTNWFWSRATFIYDKIYFREYFLTEET